MKKEIWLLGIGMLLLAACTSTPTYEQHESYKVMHPLVADTFYVKEYVAELHAMQNVEIRSRVNGIVEDIFVDEGQSVKKGQLLFSINSKMFRQGLQKAQAATQSAIAELKSAQIAFENAKKLLEKKVIGQPEYDLALAEQESLKAKLEMARAEESQAALMLSYAEVKAPFDGTINRIPNKIGSLAEEGTLLTTISNTKDVFAYFHVSENDYLEYASAKQNNESESVSLLLANGSFYTHTGKIETSESEFDRNTGNIAFRARFPNPKGIIKHGASGKIQLKKTLKNALIIPQKSTFEMQENVYVFVLDKENKVRQRRIVPLYRLSQVYVIGSGLSTDDKIIYEGIQKLKDGDLIHTELISSTLNNN